jgi:hypothetical protein
MPVSAAERRAIVKENLASKRGGPRPSLRGRINLHCKDCIYDSVGAGLGTWRQQIEDCGDTGCPLWAVRPRSTPDLGQKEAGKAPNSSAIASQGGGGATMARPPGSAILGNKRPLLRGVVI